MIKAILLYIPLMFASILFKLLTWILSPILALIAAVLKRDKLPGFLSWFHTHDTTIWGGKPMPTTFKERYKFAIYWLCRNPGYGFAAFILGFKSNEIVDQTTYTNGKEWGGRGGLRYDKMRLTNDRIRFGFRWNFMVIPNSRYFKIWFGWVYVDQAGYRMLKIDFNPLKKVTTSD